MLVAGIDDAGRGAILGPLVIAGVLLDERELPKLVALGVKDSKILSPRRREQLTQEIPKIALKQHIVSYAPDEIDYVVNCGRKLHRLNWLEARGMADVIVRLNPDVAFVDASDVLPERFKTQILEQVPFNVKVVSEHRADRNYPIVSAASIVAKVCRDDAIALLRREYGDIGSGYPSDERTMDFLETWISEHSSYPIFVRKSWKPAKRLLSSDKFQQMKIA